MIQFRQQGGYAMLSYEEFSDIYDNASDEVKVEIEEILNSLASSPGCGPYRHSSAAYSSQNSRSRGDSYSRRAR